MAEAALAEGNGNAPQQQQQQQRAGGGVMGNIFRIFLMMQVLYA